MTWTLLVISYIGGPWDGYSSTIPFPSMAECRAAAAEIAPLLADSLDGDMHCVPIGAPPAKGGEG